VVDLTVTDDHLKVAMRQIAGVFAQLEKARLVSKLKAARDRKRATGVKVEGRKSYAEIDAKEHNGRMLADAANAISRARRRISESSSQSWADLTTEMIVRHGLFSSNHPDRKACSTE
jgi:DNA invertase Pin-like site-specific DNA recombinase